MLSWMKWLLVAPRRNPRATNSGWESRRVKAFSIGGSIAELARFGRSRQTIRLSRWFGCENFENGCKRNSSLARMNWLGDSF